MRLITESKTRIPVLVVFGATASGKTALAESLFSKSSHSVFSQRAEIISADSMQVYKGMDIGTAKASATQQLDVPHHLLDVCTPDMQFSTGEFVRLADISCLDIFKRKKLPVILGGTAFYIQNFMFGLPTTPQADDQTRQALQNDLRIKGALAMHEYLRQLDSVSADRIHVNDEYRILRALEVCVASGKPLSSFNRKTEMRSPYDFTVIALHREREDLYERIDRRVDGMFSEGLEDEILNLLQKGYKAEDPGMQAIGYREFFLSGLTEQDTVISKTISDLAREKIKSNSKKYAKRQITFFKSLDCTRWFSADNMVEIEKYVKKSILMPC